MTSGTPVRVHAQLDADARGVSTMVSAALAMLVDAARIELVGPMGRPDIVHTVGDRDRGRPVGAQRVHTVHRLPLRTGRLAPEPSWLRHERRRIGGSATWIVHGQTAGRLLVQSGVVSTAQLRCLPLLSPPELPGSGRGGDRRAATRTQLGVAPGVKVVLGIEATGADRYRAPEWYREPVLARRRDAVVTVVRPIGPDAYCVRRSGGGLIGPFALSALLDAADLFVAASGALDAWSPGAAAVERGVPVVAAGSDSSAELVVAGGRGVVTEFGADHVAAAVCAELDAGLPHARGRLVAEPSRGCAQLARALLSTYRTALLTATGRRTA